MGALMETDQDSIYVVLEPINFLLRLMAHYNLYHLDL